MPLASTHPGTQGSAFQPGFARLALDPDRRLDGRCCSQLDLVTDQRDPGLEVTLDGFDRALSAHCQRQGCMEFDRSTLYDDAEPAVANSAGAGRAPVLGLCYGKSLADHALDERGEAI